MTVYIAGPMTNHKDYNRPAFFAAERMLRAHGCDVANPATLPDGQSYEWYINQGLEMLKRCDAIYLLPGWTDSAGARKEAAKAVEWGIPVWEVVA